ncbi:unnamed protein product [Rodentolepis nana]|uniref:Expressed conserved protein n=1 Tax=Rodentolepis nana TaxID=102285 RepID=A0A0R3T4S6_RODNA|nr:unnamed protein product [Rodentolepis nana]
MKGASPRIYQITESRDGYLYSAYFQVPVDDSDSSREDSLDDERRWVIYPLAPYYETQEIHGKKKEQKRSKNHKDPLTKNRYSEKSLVPHTLCLFVNDEKDKYSLPLTSCPTHLSSCEEEDDIRQYGLVTQQPKPPTLSIPLKPDREPLPSPFPIQRKMLPTRTTGSFSGSKPRNYVRGISLERKHSTIKTKNRSRSLRSNNNMYVSQSDMGHSAHNNAAYVTRLQDIDVEVNRSASNSRRSIKRSNSRHLVSELRS